jgi:hypothetical protein
MPSTVKCINVIRRPTSPAGAVLSHKWHIHIHTVEPLAAISLMRECGVNISPFMFLFVSAYLGTARISPALGYDIALLQDNGLETFASR